MMASMFLEGLVIIITSLAAYIDATGPGPGIENAFTAQMQSRAVDTGVDLRVDEGQPIGSYVGKIPTKPGFTYRFNEVPKEFTLDARTGEIKTTAILDRESIDKYALVVLSSQPTYPIEVRIRVMDINDNFPEFPEESIAVAFSESAAAGTRLLLDAATDKDLGENGVANDYRIIEGDPEGKFRLNLTVNPSGQTFYLHLETTGKLDRENNDFYVLNISARDGGNPPKYGFLQVNVTILDVNDNPPIFDQSDFSASLNESVPPGTQVLKVTATDSDLGENAKITYSVADSEQQFTVDPESGIISTVRKLKCPKYCGNSNCNMTCVLTVIAKDNGIPRQDARTYVTINLIDANDHDPVITFTYVPATANFATVDENAKNGSVVAVITVIDLDEGLNGKTSIQITSGNELNHFRLESTSSVYIVHVNGILDREEISKYNLTVVAEDKGSPPRSTTSFLIIHVNDVNDHEPVFEKSEYSTVLSELAPPGTYVAGITATDADTGVNAEIYYDYYRGDGPGWFEIDHISGLVTTTTYLDRELLGSVELNVSARDGGPNPKWAFTRLKITILDENDEAPQFVQKIINVNMQENNIKDKEIVTLTATDQDQGTNGSVSYSLHQEVFQRYQNTFSLDTLTGQLRTNAALDREKIADYEIKVIAKDQGVPPQSSTATVWLHVQDVNDNKPIFYPQKYFLNIDENLPSGTTVFQIKATDLDEGNNAKITYSLENGGDGYFRVEKETGFVILTKQIKDSPKTLQKLLFSAKDSEGNTASEYAVAEIVKSSVQKHLLFDLSDGYDFKVVEDYGKDRPETGRFVGAVHVINPTDSVSYHVLDGDESRVFKINEKNGAITTDSNVDREEKLTYRLKIVARAGLAYGFTTVNISVLDVNDNHPIFIKEGEDVLIPENMAVSHEIYYSRANDRDSGENRTLTYSLSQNPDELFRISEGTGVIYLNKPISSDPGTNIRIQVTATDNGRPRLSSEQYLNVYFEDVNDHTPVFDHTSYETSLLESTLVNTRFFAVSASDADLGDNGKISYSISEGNIEDKFGIFPDGYLYVKSALDREEQDYFSLTLKASDNGKEPRYTEVPLVIHILDENDNSPKFTNNSFIFTIYENEPPETFVGKLTAFDKDIGRNAEFTFSIATIQEDFAIDSKNGFLKSMRSFDREYLVQHTGHNGITITVTVHDNGKKKLYDSVKVTIYVLDVNDNEPVFLNTPYKVPIPESTSPGASIFRVVAIDKDQGLNGDVYFKMTDEDESDYFVIDSATGYLTLRKKLDRESRDKYKLTVLAYDSGQERSLTSSTVITINVLDENDNAPVFSSSESEIFVLETESIDKKIMQFQAHDSDLGINSEILYTITHGNRKDSFYIDPQTGALYLHKQLDYEETTKHILNITATDSGNPSLFSTISFTINVVDANDNPPIFTNTAIVRQIREGIQISTPIVTVTAEDPDSGINGKVFYHLIHQEPYSRLPHFSIDNHTGIISTLRPIDREQIDTFRLTVVASDMAEPKSTRLTAEKLVTVIVEDINDNSPIFYSMNAAVLNSESVRTSSDYTKIFVMNIQARDLDSGTNGLVTYKLTGGATDIFSLHRSSGLLTLRRRPEEIEGKWNLVVKATDEAVQKEQKSTETYITIISGGHQFPDIKWSSPRIARITENEPSGTPVMNVTASHPSVKFEYYITNVTSDGKQVDKLFDIDTGLGILSTAVPLDRESGVNKYEVEVCAVTLGGPLRTSSTKVEIIVLDENDSPPSFQKIPPAFLVSEDMPPGHSIATIEAEDPDTIGEISYSILTKSEIPFTLETKTGVLKLKEPVDRETKSEYLVEIRAEDGVQWTDITITIKVSDTNDNPPQFIENVYSFDILENAPRGSIVGTVAATDPDIGVNSEITYTVISDWANDVFSLNPQTGVFTLTARLDYEEVQHYILVVQAQDNGRPALTSTVTVYCNVLDLNDNAPIFDPMSYSIEIYENISIATSVLAVSATDLDSDFNSKLKYTITSGDENHDFSIADNGTIYSANLLDRERKSQYILIVTARDQARPPNIQLLSSAQVIIYLKDVNDMAPEFVSKNTTEVIENTLPNTAIMTIKAIDRDEGRNGYVEYYMTPEPYTEGMFSLGNVDGILRVVGNLDRESKPEYTLSITARDRGDPPRTTQTQLRIIINDQNDNSPIFDPKQYSASVPENASIGASVLQVSATDIDEGVNGRVRYSISMGDENRDFSISEDTGIIRVAKNLNYERIFRYVLTVKAEDCSNEEINFDTAEVSISILDINDNSPTFLDSPYLAYVMENTIPPNGGYIITVKAFDADTPPFNNQVRYFIKEGDSDLFKINSSTGDISLMKKLDREIQDAYTLSLVAMDTGSPPLTGSGTVRIIVQDVNDHSPQFDRQTYTATISENSPQGSTVLIPLATDNDIGNNAKIKYSLLGEFSNRFLINQDTGIITSQTILDREEQSWYYFILMAQDSATTDPKTNTANFTIIIADENDNLPVFSSNQYEVYVSEKTSANNFVFGAKAVDIDDGDNGKVKYSIDGEHSNLFRINENTGVIKAIKKLSDLRSRNTFNLKITAKDCGKPPKQSSADLQIILKPDIYFPKFSSNNKLSFSLPEDTQEGVLVTRLYAKPSNENPRGALQFSEAGGNVADALKIDSTTGEIFVTSNSLDFETNPFYNVWFSVKNPDYPLFKSSIEVEINVTDTNDNPPVMENSALNATVLEEEPAPQLVIKVSASDKDLGQNGEIRYSLLEETELFEIDEYTGEIFTTDVLDRETNPIYKIVVKAYDLGTPSLSGISTIIVTVLDKNDNPPRFTRLFSVNVTENSEIGSFVIRVTSSDQDLGSNANASYSFTENPGEKFSIDPISGNITVIGMLDREQQDEYILKVVATDGAWAAETPITITIQDQNDNAPEFEYSFYSFNFPEMQKSVTYVGQVIAIDKDKQGPNSVISYSFQQPTDLFTIDPATGEIFSKIALKFKKTLILNSPENSYSITVIATDNGKPPMSSECLVTVNVVDSNNNAPEFEKGEYLTPVPQNAQIGEKIIQVVAKDDLDFGVNADVEYSIVGGNASEYFVIDRQNGWIATKKRLERIGAYYQLFIKATDRGIPSQSTEAIVTLIVTGENKYKPEFSAVSHQVIVPENEPIGTVILKVNAYDKDKNYGPNGMVRYSISGGNSKHKFKIDPVTGEIIIADTLDYDSIDKYQLQLTASDLGFKPLSTTAMLTILLTDINDNPPSFNQTEYHAYLPENSLISTFVYQVHAIDIDSAKNAIVRYYIISPKNQALFEIDSKSGIIYSKAVFDFEEQTSYVLEIMGENPGSSMKGLTKVIIHITGVNEYTPKFIQSVFHFDVSESAEIGTNVGTIEATDQDSGEDGEIMFLFVGSSNDKGFAISSKSGMIRVSRYLDRETQNRVVLTVLAKNKGGIRGNDTDEAQVIISIQDGNDPPVFLQSVYEIAISEGSKIGTKVTTVKAIDKDIRPQNNQFSYSIIDGNVDYNFKIDAQSGEIETSNTLDRERTPMYQIIVAAIDTGVPPQTGTATVKILLSDINDNGPIFKHGDFIGSVYENEPPNTVVTTITATDPDLPPNGAPFSFAITGGSHKNYVKIEKHTGRISTARVIDRESTPILDIIIEIEDSGSPIMKSRYPCKIEVLDRNDNPSTPRSAHVLVYAIENKNSPGVIANVKPNDQDMSGDYHCKIMKDSTPERVLQILSLHHGCNLYTNKIIPGQGYVLSILGNDGAHEDVTSSISVEFFTLTEETINESVNVKIMNITSNVFLSKYYRSFIDTLKGSFQYKDYIYLYSINEIDKNIEISLGLKNRIINKRETLTNLIQNSRNSLLKLLQRDVLAPYLPCQSNICYHDGLCKNIRKIGNGTKIADSNALIITSPNINYSFECQCKDGYAGANCERQQDPCLPNPCQYSGQCRRQGYDFQCICPSNKEGKHCEIERSDVCINNPCKNGGTCKESQDRNSYFCLCRPGYRGTQCDTVVDSCRPNPCLYDGICISLKPGYKCSCADGRYGKHCESSTYGFNDLSFMKFSALDSTTNDVSITFSTTKPDSLLLYNFGAQTGGRSDFIAIELIDGNGVFSFGAARSSITSLRVTSLSNNLADGNWYRLTATRNGKVASLSVSNCTDHGDVCSECRPGSGSCYVDDIGQSGTLNFNNEPVLIGGLAKADPVLERRGQIHTDDFVGCIHSISINGKALNLTTPLQSHNVNNFCSRSSSGVCSMKSESVCGEFGKCIDRWVTSYCDCGRNLIAPNCVLALMPISLSNGGYLQFVISEKHRRMQLLDFMYFGSTTWAIRKPRSTKTLNSSHLSPSKSISFLFRTSKKNGLLFYAGTEKYFTVLALKDGILTYTSRQNSVINMPTNGELDLINGQWHNVTLLSHNRGIHLWIDEVKVGYELDAAGVHDFFDPYLTEIFVGGIPKGFHSSLEIENFEGCLANLTVNNEIQPFNGSGSIFSDIIHKGKVEFGCDGTIGIELAQNPDPLSIGITLVIVFFVILIVAILISFIVFRLRKHGKDKIDAPPIKTHVMHSKQNGNTIMNAPNLLSLGNENMSNRSLHTNEMNLSNYIQENGDILRNHHILGPELLSKKYKERDIIGSEHQRPQRPDIIEREVMGKSAAMREDPPPPPSSNLSHQTHDHPNGLDLNLDMPEHYDLENASSIAPSDIDIIYHYKGYRDGMRKYKATPPPVATYHHKHQTPQHRHSPHHASGYPSRVLSQTGSVQGGSRQHQTTPLARLSPSSEISSQQPRILTLQDISGKPLQSALLATTSSSGGVGKDVLHSNSERSLNSPVMSQLSGQSSSASRKTPGAPPPVPTVDSVRQVAMSLTAEEIDRLNARQRSSSLVSTLDAVSSSSEAPRVSGPGHHMSHRRHSPQGDNRSSTSSDESGNDSFTCSEIEYDNNSLHHGDKYSKNDDRTNVKPPLLPPPYDAFDSSYRGSLSTLVASDDDLAPHMNEVLYRQSNGSSATANLGWDYLLNWGPNFENLIGVFKDIAELPDSLNGRVPSGLRIPNGTGKPPEEYV